METKKPAPAWPPGTGSKMRSKVIFAMRNIATAPLRGQASRRPDAMGPSDRLHRLAREVERLAVGGRFDPELVLAQKQDLAAAIRLVAAELTPAGREQ